MKTNMMMHIRIAMTLLACFFFTSLMAQQQDSTVYPIVIQFNSIGTGVPTDSALRRFIISYKKKNKIKKIRAAHIGPMGREGEYWLCFLLEELTPKQAAAFRKGIKNVAEKPTERGSTVFVENMALGENQISGRTTSSSVIF